MYPKTVTHAFLTSHDEDRLFSSRHTKQGELVIDRLIRENWIPF